MPRPRHSTSEVRQRHQPPPPVRPPSLSTPPAAQSASPVINPVISSLSGSPAQTPGRLRQHSISPGPELRKRAECSEPEVPPTLPTPSLLRPCQSPPPLGEFSPFLQEEEEALPLSPPPLVPLDKVPRLQQTNSSHPRGCLERSRPQHLVSRPHLQHHRLAVLGVSGNQAEVLETRLNLQPSEEVRPTLQLRLLVEDSLQLLHSKRGEFSPSEVVEGPPVPPVQQLLPTLALTSEHQLPVRHHSTLEALQEEEEQPPPSPARPTCSASLPEPPTNPPPSAPASRLSSVEAVELRLLLVELLEEREAPCSVSGPGGTSPGQLPPRGGLPRQGGPGSEEEEEGRSVSDVDISIMILVGVLA